MVAMRDTPPFGEMWPRRSSVELAFGYACDVLGLPDLVQAKKTQRDLDWVMLRRLVEMDPAFRRPLRKGLAGLRHAPGA